MKCSVEYLAYLQSLITSYRHNQTEIKVDTTFDELGMDLYDVVDLILKVEEENDIVVANEDMLTMRTVQDLIEELDKSGKEELSNA